MTDQQTRQPVVEQQNPSPSGATDQTKERVKKFDEEGGDQPQAPSEHAVEQELARAREEKND